MAFDAAADPAIFLAYNEVRLKSDSSTRRSHKKDSLLSCHSRRLAPTRRAPLVLLRRSINPRARPDIPMIPLRDNAAPRRLTPINSALIAANIAIFVHEISLGAGVNAFVGRFAMVPAAVTRALSANALAPLMTTVTSMFIHGGFWHIAGNMLYLFIFGAAVEHRMGASRYLIFYLAAGIASALATVWIAPDSSVPVIGASGAIAGVLGAYFI